jgi:hypothetical protein
MQGILKESVLPVKSANVTGNRTWQNQAMVAPVPAAILGVKHFYYSQQANVAIAALFTKNQQPKM